MHVLVHEKRYASLPRWHNQNSPLPMLHTDLSREVLMTLEDAFPLIPDFEVVLETWKGNIRGYDVIFHSSEKGGNIANTRFYDQRLRQEHFAIPLDLDDVDQGWRLMIVAGDEFVYVSESNFDLLEKGILRWFKVPRDHYIREWQLAIEASIQLSEDETDRERLLRLAPPGQSLYSIRMLSAQEGWAVGGTFDQNGQPQCGSIVHYQQGKWVAQQVDTPLFDLSFVSADDGWAVGTHGAMFHFDGERWVRQTGITENTLRSISMLTNRGWIVGDDGTILRHDRAGWFQERYESASNQVDSPLHCVVARWSNDAWAVGDNGHILGTTKKGWVRLWNCTYHINSLSLASSGGWWAVGEKGVMIQCKTRCLHDAYRREDVGPLYSVSMLSEEDGWCFGAQGVILHYNGSTWEVQPNESRKDLRGSSMISPEEGWCVGQDNIILHYHNGVWQKENLKEYDRS
jgi:photosystem II stability/assembly factor-like uncharacterized protein